MTTYLFTYALALLLSTALTPVVIAWAQRSKLVDKPDARKIHTRAIARVGGIAIFLGAMLAILPALAINNSVGSALRQLGPKISALLVVSTLMFLVGLYDDLKGIGAKKKLAAQCLCAGLVCLAGICVDAIHIRDLGTLQLGWLGYPITILWIVGVTNAINLIDGLDGLAAGICGIACAVMAMLAMWQGNVVLAVVMLALFGALTGFLFFNFHPARIFMGDCGSLFLGFLIATSSVLTASKAEALVGIALPMLVLGIPIFDTLLSIVRRLLARHGIMSPDSSHFHHVLLRRGLRQHHVAIIAYGITLLVSGFGLFMMLTRSTFSILVLVSSLALLLTALRITGVVQVKETLEQTRKRIWLLHQQHLERRSFEKARLSFHDAQTFDQWWECMCKAAKALDLTRLSLEMANQESARQSKSQKARSVASEHRIAKSAAPGLCWKNGHTDDEMPTEDVLRMTFPVNGHPRGDAQYFKIDIVTNGSLESAGRRAALFARLASENQFDSPTPENQKAAIRDSVSGHSARVETEHPNTEE